MVGIYSNARQEANQDYEEASCFHQIEAFPGHKLILSEDPSLTTSRNMLKSSTKLREPSSQNDRNYIRSTFCVKFATFKK